MRIPPAVAREIGQMYAAARVNETAARDLTAASERTNGALVALGRADHDAAVADARTAAELIARVAASPDSTLDAGVRAAAEATGVLATHVVDVLAAGEAPVDMLSTIVTSSTAAARSAASTAAYHRHAADELSREWM